MIRIKNDYEIKFEGWNGEELYSDNFDEMFINGLIDVYNKYIDIIKDCLKLLDVLDEDVNE